MFSLGKLIIEKIIVVVFAYLIFYCPQGNTQGQEDKIMVYSYAIEININKEIRGVLERVGLVPSQPVSVQGDFRTIVSDDKIIFEIRGFNFEDIKSKMLVFQRDFLEKANKVLDVEREEEIHSVVSNLGKKRDTYNNQLDSLRKEIISIETRLQQIRIQNKVIEEQKIFLEKKLKELELKKEQLLNVYTPSHPQVKDILSQIDIVQKDLQKIKFLEEENVLERQLEKYKSEYNDIEGKIKNINEDISNYKPKIYRIKVDNEREDILFLPKRETPKVSPSIKFPWEKIIFYSTIVFIIFLVYVIILRPLQPTQFSKMGFYKSLIIERVPNTSHIFRVPLDNYNKEMWQDFKAPLNKLIEEGVNLFWVTSFSSKEGKTFTSLNLAHLLTSLGKDVVLVSFQPQNIFRSIIYIPFIKKENIFNEEILEDKIKTVSDLIILNQIVIKEINEYRSDKIRYVFLDKNTTKEDILEIKGRLRDYFKEHIIILDLPWKLWYRIDKNEKVVLVYRYTPRIISLIGIRRILALDLPIGIYNRYNVFRILGF